MPLSFVLGMEGKLYIGTAGAELTAMTEFGNVKDVTTTLEKGDSDVTTRGNSGWRATVGTLKECTLEFEMQWSPGNTDFDAVLAGYLNNTLVEFAPLDRAKDATSPGPNGPKGSFSITNFSRSEALEEAMKVSVTAKLAVFDEWIGAAA